MMSDPDPILLERWARERDAEAFRTLVDRHASLVHSTARRIVRRVDLTEDVTQECFLRLSRLAPTQAASIPAWLHRVATNLAISLVRAERARHRAERRKPSIEDAGDARLWEDLEPLIDEAVEALPEKERVSVVERFLRNRTYDSIAKDLGVSKETVGYRVRSGLERIRRHLRRHGVRTEVALLSGALASFASRTGHGLPPASIASLGKIAISGARAVGSQAFASSFSRPGAALLVSGGLMKATICLAVSLILVLGIAAYFFRDPEAPLARPEPTAPPVAVADSSGDSAAAKPTASQGGSAPESVAEKVDPPPGANAEEAASPTITVRGRVVDSSDAPVPGAKVFLALPPPAGDPRGLERNYLDEDYWSVSRLVTTTSGDEGEFELTGLPVADAAYLTASAGGEHGFFTLRSLEDAAAREAVILRLELGRTLEGRIIATDGSPVTDAVVSAYHSYSNRGHAGAGGFTSTDGEGHFSLGIDRRATHLTLRVSSASQGQRFFTEIAVDRSPVVLQLVGLGSVHGQITWTDGQPATGLSVVADAEVPEPPALQVYTGVRYRTQRSTLADENGAYEITGLQPGFTYHVFVKDPDDETYRTLSPRWENRIAVDPGDSVEWNAVLTRTIRVTGRVLTAETRSPVPRVRIAVEKDGQPLEEASSETDAGSNFELVLNTGPGTYRICATPEFGSGSITELIAGRFAKTAELREGDDLRLDLEIYDPIRIPVRVIDASGRPVESIRSELSLVLPGGERAGIGNSHRLDSEGRYTFEIFHPVDRIKLEICAFPDGPPHPLGEMTAAVGTTLPERTIVFDPTCDLSGRLLASGGEALASEVFTIEVQASDGARDSFTLRTDEEGGFEAKARVRAAPATLRISVRGRSSVWTSKVLDFPPGGAVSLGDVVVGE